MIPAGVPYDEPLQDFTITPGTPRARLGSDASGSQGTWHHNHDGMPTRTGR